MQGGDNIGVLNAALPDIAGGFGISGCSDAAGGYGTGAFSFELGGTAKGTTTAGAGDVRVSFSAAKSNSVYGASTTVQPPALQLVPQIKF